MKQISLSDSGPYRYHLVPQEHLTKHLPEPPPVTMATLPANALGRNGDDCVGVMSFDFGAMAFRKEERGYLTCPISLKVKYHTSFRVHF